MKISADIPLYHSSAFLFSSTCCVTCVNYVKVINEKNPKKSKTYGCLMFMFTLRLDRTRIILRV